MGYRKVQKELEALRAELREQTATESTSRPPTPAEFRNSMNICANGAIVPLRDNIDDWQRLDFEKLDPAFLQLAGFPIEGRPVQNFFYERPRGHSKTGDACVMAAWLLAYSPIRQ